MKDYTIIDLESKLSVLTVSSFAPFTVISFQNGCGEAITSNSIIDDSFDKNMSLEIYSSTDSIETNLKYELKQATYQPEWVRENTKLGNLGENIAYFYLRRIFNGNVKWESIISDRRGYDFEANGHYYEVKTTYKRKDKVSFFLSYNEMQTYLKHQGYYHIIYVHIDESTKAAQCLKNDDISLFYVNDFFEDINEYQQTVPFSKHINDLISVRIDNVMIEMGSRMLTTIDHVFTDDEIREINRFFAVQPDKQ